MLVFLLSILYLAWCVSTVPDTTNDSEDEWAICGSHKRGQ